MSSAAPSPDAAKSPWLVSPIVDVLIGAGGIYLVIALVLGVAGNADVLDPTTAACLALAIGGPHYGATLLRAYGNAQAREQFKNIGTYATAGLVVAVIASLWVPIIGALIVTLYFTWVAYHYAAQSYGVTRMLLARRTVPIDDRFRRALQTVFVSSSLLWVVSIHTDLASRAPVSEAELYPLLRLGLPLFIGTPLLLALGAVMLGCVGYVVKHLVASRALDRSGPALVLMLGQMTWFALPVLAIRTGFLGNLVPFSTDTRTNMFIFIALTHASQHLWVALYHAKKQHGGAETTHFLRSLAAGSLVWGLPSLLLPLGPVPTEMGVAILVAGAVNIHHFALDGVVWKLRDPKNAALVTQVKVEQQKTTGQLLLAFGAVVLVLQLGGLVIDRELSALVDHPDRDRIGTIEPIARFIGRDGPSLRTALVSSEVLAGNCEEASRELEAVPSTWTIRADVRDAVAHCGEQLSMAPAH